MVVLLKEEPSRTDQLGSHTRVASGLAELLTDAYPAKTIGILGRWGSGKSTTINLAQHQIVSKETDEEKTIFFIYDAWAHESDPPRRAFLENLARHLQKIAGVDPNDWSNDMDVLTKRSEIHDLTTTPTLTGWGTALAVAIALAPIGMFLSRTDDFWRHIGNLLLFGPAAVLLVSRLFMYIISRTDKSASSAARSTAMLFFNKTTDRVRNTIIKTPEPTSMEFRDMFCKILSHHKVSCRHLVLVIDNLDRIDANDALIMWSSIRSLIDTPEHDSHYADFKIVVPFDLSELGRIFDKADAKNVADTNITRAFIEKTFDAIVVVGPPIDSDWRDYLHQALGKAFGDRLSDIDLIRAVRIYEGTLEDSSNPAFTTPRRLNSFVNSTVTVWLQWKDEISFSAICYFCCRNVWSNSALRDVLSQYPPAFSVMDRSSPDWRIEVAAIHFGVDVQKARQLVLEPEIDKALIDGDQDKFLELSRLPGSIRTIERLLLSKSTNSMEGVDPAQVLNAAAFVNASLSPSGETDEVWAAIKNVAQNIGAWSVPSRFAKAGSEALRNRSIETRPILAKLGDKDAARLEPSDWLEMAESITPLVARPTLTRTYRSPYEGNAYLNMLAVYARRSAPIGLSLRPMLLSREAPDVVVSTLQSQIGESETTDLFYKLRGLTLVDGKWDFDDIASSVEAKIGEMAEGVELLLEALLLIGSTAVPALKRLGDNGTLAHIFAVSTESGDLRGQAAAVLGLSFGRAARLSGETSIGLSAKGWDLLQDLSSTVGNRRESFLSSYEDLIRARTSTNGVVDAYSLRFLMGIGEINPSWRFLADDQLMKRLSSGSIGRRGFPDDLIAKTPWVKATYDDPFFLKFVALSSSFDSYVSLLKDEEGEPFWVVAEAAKRIKFNKASEIRALSLDRITGMEVDTWKTIILDPPPYANELLVLVGKKPSKEVRSRLTGGFEAWANDYLAGGAMTPLNTDAFSKLLALLPAEKKRIWARSISEHLTNSPLPRAVEGLEKLASLIVSNVSEEILDRLARLIIIRSAVEKSDETDQLIARSWPTMMMILRGASHEVQNDVGSRVEWISSLAATVGADPATLHDQLPRAPASLD